MVCQAWAPVFRYFMGDLWPLGRELEYGSVKDTDRCFLFARRPKRLTKRCKRTGALRFSFASHSFSATSSAYSARGAAAGRMLDVRGPQLTRHRPRSR